MTRAHREDHAGDGPLDLVIKGAEVVAARGREAVAIGVRDGVIVALGSDANRPAAAEIRADGLIVLPGLIDPHVHLGLPTGDTVTSDDPATGTAAALYGGVTTVVDFTRRRDGQSLAASLAERCREFAGRAWCDHAFHVNVTGLADGLAGRLDDEFAAVRRAGGGSLKVFTCYGEAGYALGARELRSVFAAARRHGLRILVHAEDEAMVAGATEALLAAGDTAPAHYPASRPAAAEVAAVRTVLEAAAAEGVTVYIVHVSTAGAVEAIRDARRRGGSPVFLETCPHYLLLDEAAYTGSEAAQFLVAPPLRSPADRRRLVRALGQGDVDVVATDHCCYRRAQKEAGDSPFSALPRGLPGVETRLPLVHTLLYEESGVDGHRSAAFWRRLVDCLATNPARLCGLDPRKGTIARGADADLVFFDPKATWRLTATSLHMATDFSPFADRRVRGRVRRVFLRGQPALVEGELQRPARGQYLPRGPAHDGGVSGATLPRGPARDGVSGATPSAG